MQGDWSWLRKGCSTHPAKPIATSTAACLSGRLETCSSSFPHPPEGHTSTWWQRPPRQLQLSHQGTEPAHSTAVAMGAEAVHAAPSSAHTASSHLCIFHTTRHISTQDLLSEPHGLQSGTPLLCPPVHSTARSCPAFLGCSWIATCCASGSFLLPFFRKNSYVSQLLTVVWLVKFKLRKDPENSFIKWQPKGWPPTSISQEKTRNSCRAMLAGQLCMPSYARHGPVQSQARLLPSPSPCEKTDVEPHLFAHRTHHWTYWGRLLWQCRGNLGATTHNH